MGRYKFQQIPQAKSFDLIRSFTSTAAIIANRIVKLGTAVGNVKHTTGSSGRAAIGVALAGATGAGKVIPVGLFGIFDVEASSRAVGANAWLRATSGAASTASRLGGTVRTSTVLETTALPVRANTLGMALTTAAAGTGKRLISVFWNPAVRNPFLT